MKPLITKTMNRLAQLSERYERVIELNKKNNYTSMGLENDKLVTNPKNEQYNRLLIEIKKERVKLWNERRLNPVYAQNLETAKNNIIKYLIK